MPPLQRMNKNLIRNRINIDPITECWCWTASVNTAGYGQIKVAGDSWLAHRLAYQLYIGDIPAGLYVCHKCDTPRCCNPAHLFAGTAGDNAIDCWRKVRSNGFAPGHTRSRGKRKRILSDSDVAEIRATNAPLALMAGLYGVSPSCISTTRRGKRKALA